MSQVVSGQYQEVPLVVLHEFSQGDQGIGKQDQDNPRNIKPFGPTRKADAPGGTQGKTRDKQVSQGGPPKNTICNTRVQGGEEKDQVTPTEQGGKPPGNFPLIEGVRQISDMGQEENENTVYKPHGVPVSRGKEIIPHNGKGKGTDEHPEIRRGKPLFGRQQDEDQHPDPRGTRFKKEFTIAEGQEGCYYLKGEEKIDNGTKFRVHSRVFDLEINSKYNPLPFAKLGAWLFP